MADGHPPGWEEEKIATVCQACGGGHVDLSVSCSAWGFEGAVEGFWGTWWLWRGFGAPDGCGGALGHLVLVEELWGTWFLSRDFGVPNACGGALGHPIFPHWLFPICKHPVVSPMPG